MCDIGQRSYEFGVGRVMEARRELGGFYKNDRGFILGWENLPYVPKRCEGECPGES
jgi:hypothetical protein